MRLEAGTVLGRYEIRSLVGAGGMGEIYLARDTQLGRDVALKVLPAEVAADEDRMRRFTREARAASALNHPNILTIHEIGAADSTHYIATEYVEGVTLRRLMSGARIDSAAVLDIAIQIAAALAAAHSAGVVHRDIKPENVMLRADGYVKVLDFGLAKLTGRAAGRSGGDPSAPTVKDAETGPGVIMGTVNYMSPEQARGLDVDERTDLWSLGAVLYELSSGRPPFSGGTPSDVIAGILEREPTPLTRYAPDAPAELQRVVNKALAKNREERYQTAKDLLVDLKRMKRDFDYDTQEHPAETGKGISANHDESVIGKADTEEKGSGRRTSRTRHVISGIGMRRKASTFVLLFLTALTAAAVYGVWPWRPRVDSVAVLPFRNTAGPEMVPLEDGLAESVINNLSGTSRVKVKSSSASFGYRDPQLNFKKIGQEMGVSAVLMGRIQRQGDILIVRAALVGVEDETQLWGEQYRIEDLVGGPRIFELQEEISKKISDEVKTHISVGSTRP